MFTEAIELAQSLSFSIFPVEVGGKRPLIKSWPTLATTDLDQITEWWTRWPNANIGIATGPKSGIFVLDVDGEAGLASLDHLKANIADWPPTRTARTGSGGLHYYFRWDTTRPVRNSASKLAPGLDIRGDGGYVVAPPSLHRLGTRYTWINL